jgi:hypothetical protein
VSTSCQPDPSMAEQEQSDPIRQDPRAKLRSLLRDHGERWEIRLVSMHWEAVSHPTPSAVILHCADSLDGLRAKLESDTEVSP